MKIILFTIASIFVSQFALLAQVNPVFEKLKKGVNQDVSMAYSGVYPKVQYERAHMEAIKEAGFESVRIYLPFTADYTEFETRIQDALDYNLAIVVCMWGKWQAWMDGSDADIAEFSNKWGAIANAWKDKFSNDVVFELLNEPSGIGFNAENKTHNTNLMKLYNAAIAAIRAVDEDRPILVGAPGYNDADLMDPWLTEKYLTYKLSDSSGFFEDPNIGVAIHYYAPRNKDGDNFAMWTAPLKNGWKAAIDYHIDHAVDWQIKHETNMPVVVTEWGCWIFDSRTNSQDLKDWLDYNIGKFEENNFGAMWYTGIQNNQRQFAIFDSELGWNEVVLNKITGVSNPEVPATSQIIDAEFVNFGSETWNLTSTTGVTKSFVSGASALSGRSSVKLTVEANTDCQMYQETIESMNGEPRAPGRTLLHLIQGKTYKISFMAKSQSGDGRVKVMLKDAKNLSTIYYESAPQEITTTTQHFDLYYKHTTQTAMDVRFEFDFNYYKAQTLILDKVSLRQADTTVVSTEPPSAPSDLTSSEVSSSSLKLNWTDNADDEDGFVISRNGSVIDTVGANVTEFIDEGIESGTEYEYSVYAFNSVGNSAKVTHTVSTTTGIKQQITGNISIEPNLVKDRLYVRGIDTEMEWTIISLTGAVMSSGRTNDINVAELKSGYYLLKLETTEGVQYIKKFVKQ